MIKCLFALKWNFWIFGSVDRIFKKIFVEAAKITKFGASFILFSQKRWNNTQSDKNWVHNWTDSFDFISFYEIGQLMKATQYFSWRNHFIMLLLVCFTTLQCNIFSLQSITSYQIFLNRDCKVFAKGHFN